MLENVTAPRRTVEFGIYRDGDNNLDASQANTLAQALQSSERDSHVEYTVQDTTGLRVKHGDVIEGKTRTDEFTVADGRIGNPQIGKPHDMADPQNLARFVAQTLDNAERSGAKQTWIELVDHGGGDGGGLETHDGKVMSMPDIADAIAQGVKMHAQAHPEDAGRGVDGVVANQCLMATLGFADALSHAGVKYLAASPETMVSPGVPSDVADAIAKNAGDAGSMGKSVVADVMHAKYGAGGIAWGPAAAFDVIDLAPEKMRAVESSVKALNDDIAARKGDASQVAALRDDAKANPGMVRFSGATPDMPWHADRPAIALYDTIAADGRLDARLRADAKAAASAVGSMVVAHAESKAFGPFDGSDYRDAVGPTVHFPVNKGQIDPWAPGISETHNRFFAETDAAAAEGVIA